MEEGMVLEPPKELECVNSVEITEEIADSKLGNDNVKILEKQGFRRVPLIDSPTLFSPNPSESMSKFVRNDKASSLEEIFDQISEPTFTKTDSCARADICRVMKSSKISINKGKIRDMYGYENGNESYLYPEETLYLLEIGKLELYCDEVSLSVERARSLLLHSDSPVNNADKIQTCHIDEYAVYKYLSKLGYRLIRKSKVKADQNEATKSVPIPTPMDVEGSGDKEDPLEIEIITDEIQINNGNDANPDNEEILGLNRSAVIKRGVKRKADDKTAPQNVPILRQSSFNGPVLSKIAEEPMESGDDDCEVIGMGPLNTAVPVPIEQSVAIDSQSNVYLVIQSSSFGLEEDEEDDDDEEENYTVAEADSDIEIVDEVYNCHSGVVIEEIEATDEQSTIPFCMPSTSRGVVSSQVVDLVSSDSEPEEANEGEESLENVWTKFVPNGSGKLTFPPPSYLPENIPWSEKVYNFNFTKGGEKGDLDLEMIDGLNLDSGTKNANPSKVPCNSWKEWRETICEEVRGLRNDSLLGDPDSKAKSVYEKLDLWPTKSSGEFLASLNIPYDLYPPTLTASRKRMQGMRPKARIVVVKGNERVPDFSTWKTKEKDVPLLVAIVCDESDIIFLMLDKNIQSLF